MMPSVENVETAYLRTELVERRERLAEVRSAHPDAADLTRLLREVDAALERLDLGTYGICESCHEPIERDRLLADPLLRYCLPHLTPAQQEALQQDLDLAVRIQASLLPGANLRTGGWEACYHYEPLGPVSGDYCDLVAMDSGLFFITSDVSGKGVASSLLMSHLHAIFHSLLKVGMPIGQLVTTANRVFCESTLPSFYATAVCGQAHPDGEIEIVNAGHCPPVLVRPRGISTVEASAIPLGMFCSGEFPACRFHLDRGDCVVLYTDGLTEARNARDEEYGPERLAAVLRGLCGGSPQDIARACLTDLDTFLSGAAKSDDVTLMVIHREN